MDVTQLETICMLVAWLAIMGFSLRIVTSPVPPRTWA